MKKEVLPEKNLDKPPEDLQYILNTLSNFPIDFEQVDNSEGVVLSEKIEGFQKTKDQGQQQQRMMECLMDLGGGGFEELNWQQDYSTATTITNEEEKLEQVYLIKNLATGEVIDIRDNENLDKLNKRYTIMKSTQSTTETKASSSNQWKDYKRQVRLNNDKMRDFVENGDYNGLKGLLDKQGDYPIDLNVKGLDNFTPLHCAANEGYFDICRILIEKGAQPDAKTKMKRTPLHLACSRGYINLIQLFLKSKCGINEQDEDGQTALHLASERGHVGCVEVLLNSGAGVSIKNRFGLTAYDVAASPEVISVFKQKKAVGSSEIYSRVVVGNNILGNSRADHVSKLLYQSLKNSKMAEQVEKEKRVLAEEQLSGKQKNFRNVQIEEYGKEAIKNPPKEKIGPHSFLILCMLGKGSFGEVYLVKKIDTNELYAMKVLKKEKVLSNNMIRYARTERNVLSLISHPFIVNLYFAFQTANKLYLVVKYCPGGDLASVISKKKRLPEAVARIYLCEILLGIEELHKNSIVFRDLKPENVVIDEDGHALLTDFGLSKEGVNTNYSKSFCGSIAYLPPEMLKRAGHNRTVDYYLFGVLAYELLVGIPPYFAPNRDQLFDNILNASLRIPRELSEESKSLIKLLLNRNPENRLGAKGGVEDIKNHPFFKGIIWEDVLAKKYMPPPCERKNIPTEFLNIRIQDAKVDQKKVIPDWSFVGEDM